MSEKSKHLHKVNKHKYKNGTSIFFCTLPDCHYKIEVPLSIGKEFSCCQCGNKYIMNEYTIRLLKPHCSDCGRKEIKMPDGSKRYVNKRLGNEQILSEVAESNVSDLRNRLNSITSNEKENDI